MSGTHIYHTYHTPDRYTIHWLLVQSHHAHTFLCCVYISRVGSVDMYIKILLTLPFFFFLWLIDFWLIPNTVHSSCGSYFYLMSFFLFFSSPLFLWMDFASKFQHLVISDFKNDGLGYLVYPVKRSIRAGNHWLIDFLNNNKSHVMVSCHVLKTRPTRL